MAIVVKSRDEIAIMKEAGRIVSAVRDLLVDSLRPGMVELELDEIARREFKKAGVIPTFLGYHGYPAAVCVTINDEIVHGIPGRREILDGDVVSIDIGCTFEGFVADTAVSVGVGNVSQEAQHLIDVTREAVWRGIHASRAGSKTGDIGHAIQTYVEGEGLAIVREYVGHGVGRQMHEDPQVPNYGQPGTGTPLRPGMVIAIEPMVNLGDCRTKREDDEWAVRQVDAALSEYVAHTLSSTVGEAALTTFA